MFEICNVVSVFDGLTVGEGGPPFYQFTKLDEEGKLFKLLEGWRAGKAHPSGEHHEDSRSEYAIVEARAIDLAKDEEVLLPVSSKRLAVALGASDSGEGDTIRISRSGEGMDTDYQVEVVS